MKKLYLYGILAGAILSLMVIPPLLRETFILSFLILVLMHITVDSAWNIIGGFTGYNNFGHVVFFGIGAYITGIITCQFRVPSMLVIPIGGLVASMFAALVGYPILRLKGIYFALGTLPLSYVINILIVLLPFTGGPEGINIRPPFSTDPLTTEAIFYVLFLVTALGTILLSYKLLFSRIGYGLLSIREDEDAARCFGVPVDKLKVFAYSISAFPTAIVGGIYMNYMLYIDPATAFAFSLSIYAIGANYLGGRGTITGPIIGSGIFVFLSEYLRYAIGPTLEGLHLIVLGVSLVLIVVYMPEGIVGWLRRKFPAFRTYLP